MKYFKTCEKNPILWEIDENTLEVTCNHCVMECNPNDMIDENFPLKCIDFNSRMCGIEEITQAEYFTRLL